MRDIQFLADYIGLNEIPQSWKACSQEAFEYFQKNPDFLTDSYFSEAVEFYQLDGEVDFISQWKLALAEIRKDVYLQRIICLCYYLFFIKTGDCFQDAWNWDARFEKQENQMLPVFCLLSGYRIHLEILEKQCIKKEQVDYQIKSIKEVCLKGLRQYHINGISFHSMTWGLYFIFQRLVQLGCLQYEIKTYKDPFDIYASVKDQIISFSELESQTIDKKNLLLKSGEKCIGVHIPAKTVFDPVSVQSSFKRAQKELPFYFPDLMGKRIVYHCSSWLLSPQLSLFLPSESHIMHFKKRFHLIAKKEGCSDLLRFVFNIFEKDVSFHRLCEETSLQKKIKKHLLAGNEFETGIGVYSPL